MTTVEKVENYLLIDIDSSFESTAESYIDAITSYIQSKTGRTFSKDTTDSERLFDGNNSDEIYFPDFQSITTLKVDDNEIADYKLYPANKSYKNKISLENNVFTTGKQNVSVLGKWGYGNAPDDLVFASTVLVAGVVNSQNKQDGDIQSESIGRYTVSYKSGSRFESDLNLAKSIIQSYKRYDY